MGKKITFTEAKKRFAYRGDIELVEFVSWKKKSKFFDKIEQDYFWSIPADVKKHEIVSILKGG